MNHKKLVDQTIDEVDKAEQRKKDAIERYKALSVVHRFAIERVNYHVGMVGEKPMEGWSQEKHDTYHIRERGLADTARVWCFVEMMGINPD